MSFSEEIKSELARKLPEDSHCLLAELAAIIHYAGTLTGNARHGTIAIETENVVLAKKYLLLIRKAFEIPVNLDIRTSQGGRSRHYRIVLSSEEEQLPADERRTSPGAEPAVSVGSVSASGGGEEPAPCKAPLEALPQAAARSDPGASRIADSTGSKEGRSFGETGAAEDSFQQIAAGDSFRRVWRKTADWETPGFSEKVLARSCCRRAFIRGAFLTSGSMSNPGKSYHFEIVCRKREGAEVLCAAAETFGIFPKIIQRKQKFIVYLKDSESIVDMLNVMEATNALMKLENVRIIKDMKNSANRQYNCDSANINKMVRTAYRQTEDIQLIAREMGLENLNPQLKEMALVRLEHPEESLAELGQYLDPPVGKSGVNHRLKKISEIAAALRERDRAACAHPNEACDQM